MNKSLLNQFFDDRIPSEVAGNTLDSEKLAKPVIKLSKDSDLAVERGSQALARYAGRKQFASICRWLALTTLLGGMVAIAGYFSYSSVALLPWQKYLDRFDFRLNSASEDTSDQPEVRTPPSSTDDY